MQEDSLHGIENGHETPTKAPEPLPSRPEPSTEPRLTFTEVVNGTSNGTIEANDTAPEQNGEHNGEPPLKKRRMSGPITPTSKSVIKKPSPPWKRAGADGPTSFVVDGRRKSSRTNTVPLELQPQTGARNTRAAISKVNQEKVKKSQRSYSYSSTVKAQLESPGKRPSSSGKSNLSPSAPRRISQGRSSQKSSDPLRSTSGKSGMRLGATDSPSYARKSFTNGEVEEHATSRKRGRPKSSTHATSYQDAHDSSSPVLAPKSEENQPDFTMSPLRRIKLKVKMPTVSIEHPQHVVPPRRYASFQEWFAQDGEEPRPGQELLGESDIARRAAELAHVRKGFEEGGLLTEQSLRLHYSDQSKEDDIDRQEEPPRQYGHYDHLVAHALHFRKLLDRERAHHIRTAKQLVHEAARGAAATKIHRPKSESELEEERREAMRQLYRQVNRDLQKQWTMVEEDVNRARLIEWQKKQEALGKEHLNRVLEQHTQMLEARKIHDSDGETDVSEDEDLLDSQDSDLAGSGRSDDDESNMSESTEDSDDEANQDLDADAKLSLEELKRKYASVPSMQADDEASRLGDEDAVATASSNANGDINGKAADQEELEDSAMDDSDPSIDMDSDMTDSQESESSSTHDSEESTEEEEEDVAGGGLLGFFGAATRKEILTVSTDQQVEDGANEEDSTKIETAGLETSVDIADVPATNVPTSELPDLPLEAAQYKIEGIEAPLEAAEPHSRATEVLQEATMADAMTSTTILEKPEAASVESHGKTEEPTEQSLLENISSVPAQAAKVDGLAAVPSIREEQATILKQTISDAMGIDNDPTESRASLGPSSQASPGTLATKQSEAESFSSVEAHGPPPVEDAEPKTPNGISTPVPSLLRGNLREYQHYGLDWLAKLYANHTNGILADEMGLGKTIQSISLLAHLAEVHEVWGPHLIIVPTSVMLNWEVEFKKFLPGFKILTYYGTQEERKAKRRGWLDDDMWNVCITSYQLVLQDQVAFKRRNWHYMILDEAHNIKNFRSQRWQTMLGFKTRARLLLTGTPLQNNLTELWSLLFFLQPSDLAQQDDEGFAGLKDFSEWFRKPVDQILEHGRDTMDDEAREQVAKLHKVIRPYLLRRIKADVEKQMPGKYEHVEMCRLSKRQRQLYDGFMSRAQTKETLASGNYLSIINCLMQLRKVCNHPDLFETRPVTTSFSMSRPTAADFEIKDLLIRRRLVKDEDQRVDLRFLQLAPVSREDKGTMELIESSRLTANEKLRELRARQFERTDWNAQYDGRSMIKTLRSMDNAGKKARTGELERLIYSETYKHNAKRIYGQSLLERLTIDLRHHGATARATVDGKLSDGPMQQPSLLKEVMLSTSDRALQMEPLVQKFACITPAVVAPGMAQSTLTNQGIVALQEAQQHSLENPFHEAQTRLSIAFPDKRLLQYDCGKLQRLDKLLRRLQSGGHRALIFTQMTKVLDVLEQFLNIHGHRYLRLDGSTKLEQRQIITDRFNNDTRILTLILSSRSGGLGLNLTGADTVIFYDLDWNPAMDKQCQDRAHRIGQTRDVHIYRFVSEHTIESNILRKSNQKRMLDDVIIQEGEFTTDYFNKMSYKDMLPDEGEDEAQDEANAAMDRVLGNARGGVPGSTLAQAEDAEDAAAAKAAEREVQHVDADDFDEKALPKEGLDTPAGGTGSAGVDGDPTAAGEGKLGTIDDFMLRIQAHLLKDTPLPLPANKNKKRGAKKGQEHRVRRKR